MKRLSHVELEVAEEVRRVQLAVRAGLETAGFAAKENVLGDGERFVGLEFIRKPARWQPHRTKLGDLDRVLEILEAAHTVPVDLLRVTVALYVWMALLRREAMADEKTPLPPGWDMKFDSRTGK